MIKNTLSLTLPIIALLGILIIPSKAEASNRHIIAVDASKSTFLYYQPKYTQRLANNVSRHLKQSLKEGDEVLVRFLGEHNSEIYFAMPNITVNWRHSADNIANALYKGLITFRDNTESGAMDAHMSSSLVYFLEDMVMNHSCSDKNTYIHFITDGLETVAFDSGTQIGTGKDARFPIQAEQFFYAGCNIALYGVGTHPSTSRNQQVALRKAWDSYLTEGGAHSVSIKFNW